MHALDANIVVNATSGLFMIILGLFVASVRGGAPWNRAFALFAVTFGAVWIVDNLTVEADHFLVLGRWVSGLLLVVATIGLAYLAGLYPEPIKTAGRVPLLLAGAATGFVVTGLVVIYVWWLGSALTDPSRLVSSLGRWVFVGLSWGVLFLFAARHGGVPVGDARTRALYAVMSAALVLYPAVFISFGTGLVLRGELDAGLAPFAVAFVVGLLLSYTAVWAWSLRGVETPGPVRWVPLLAALMALAAMLLHGANPNNVGFGLARTFTVIILAYSILKHQLLDIDVKVRWGLSKSVVAGVFIATFFVASEGAAQFFGEQTGSAYYGIGAAALLVFAIAPLNRVAERFAARAIPGGADGAHRSHDAYREAVRLALSDGQIDRNDERALAKLAAACGLAADEAWAMREEVESESARPLQ